MKAEEILKKHYPNYIYIDGHDLGGIFDAMKEFAESQKVTTEEKLKELVESAFGKEAVKDKDIMRLYAECIKYAVEEVLESQIKVELPSDEDIEKEFQKFVKVYLDGNMYTNTLTQIAWFDMVKDFGKWMRNKLKEQ